MHLYVKTFNDSAENTFAIRKIIAKAGLSYGTSIEIFYTPENKDMIKSTLVHEGIPLKSIGVHSLTIKANVIDRTNIRNALKALCDNNLINPELTQQISRNFPGCLGNVCPFNEASYENISDLTLAINLPSSFQSERITNLISQVRNPVSFPSDLMDEHEDRLRTGSANRTDQNAFNSAIIDINSTVMHAARIELGENMWTKSGDLARIYNSGGPLNRSCTYSNGATDAIISELGIYGYRDNDYQISAKAQSTDAYNRLEQAIVAAGFPAPSFTDEYLKTIRISTGDRDKLRHFIHAIKQAESSLNLIEDEIVTSLGLTNLNPVAALPIWHKAGDLTRTYNSGGPLNRSCTYSNASTDATISKLFISGYRDGHYQIRTEAKSPAAYNILKQAVINEGFPAPDFYDEATKTVSVSTGDRNRLCHFLNAIKQQEQNFNLIEDEIVSTLNLTSLNAVTPLSTWNKTGSFTETHRVGHGSLLNRQVNYTTGVQDSLIKEFQLFGYSDNTYMFCLELSEHSNALKNILLSSGLPITIDEYFTRSSPARFCFNGSNRAQFEQLLTLLSQHSPHFAEIKEQFQQHVTPVISSTSLPRITVFQQANASSLLPGIGVNQQKLNACEFSKKDLPEEEQEEFETYCCALSANIMSDPVYDPRFEQYQFERSWILQSLETKKEHPFTRELLTEGQLISNTTLKHTIDAFVSRIIAAKPNTNSSSI